MALIVEVIIRGEGVEVSVSVEVDLAGWHVMYDILINAIFNQYHFEA